MGAFIPEWFTRRRYGGRGGSSSRPLVDVRKAVQSTTVLEADLEKASVSQGLDAKAYRMAAQRAVVQLAPMIRQMVLTNYYASGLKDGTQASKDGKPHLSDAIKGLSVYLGRRGITIALSDKRVIPQAASLSYGAVYAPHQERALIDLPTKTLYGTSTRSILGGRAKRTLKKAVFAGQKLSKRAAAAQERQGVQGYKGFRYLRPRNFFLLTPAQQAKVKTEFERLIHEQIGGGANG